jgi:hypothetical protein
LPVSPLKRGEWREIYQPRKIEMPKENVFTIQQIARAVYADDQYKGNLGVEKLSHIIELALKNRIGIACRVANGVSIDIGNGHLLNCTLQKV